MKMLMEAKVPGIVPFEHMAVDEEENLYLVLRYCEGGDLFSKVKESGKLTERKAAKVLRSLAETLSCCHALGVMHRDVKLENVLLARRKHLAVGVEEEEEEEVLLGDFGLASFLQPGQRLQTVVGTLPYMAPEVIRGNYDERADVWSLGMLMHALLTGTLPFAHRKDRHASSKASVYEAILSKELDLDASAYSHLSDSARELLGGMLCKDPDRRLTLHQVQNHADRLLDMHPAIKPIQLVTAKTCSKDTNILHQDAELDEERPAVAHKQRIAGKRDWYMKQIQQRLRAAAAPVVVG